MRLNIRSWNTALIASKLFGKKKINLFLNDSGHNTTLYCIHCFRHEQEKHSKSEVPETDAPVANDESESQEREDHKRNYYCAR